MKQICRQLASINQIEALLTCSAVQLTETFVMFFVVVFSFPSLSIHSHCSSQVKSQLGEGVEMMN